ncbi:hypothetical protein XELAEV_18005884mg [Xenopus laevis]|uniref:Uncharacterized protein n=1 Tax=Xenopus laevis TaxID=8355 RepID=A0A974I3N0_XENLA|nr:hypothetical protein XELAEV_18005884mg [Xenopus laevis]
MQGSGLLMASNRYKLIVLISFAPCTKYLIQSKDQRAAGNNGKATILNFYMPKCAWHGRHKEGLTACFQPVTFNIRCKSF